MIPSASMNIVKKNRSKSISDIYDALPPASQQALMDFAEFLYQRDATEPAPSAEKQPIPRPEKESVVAALKRLNLTYPMIERNQVFHEASSLMTEHIMQGRDAADVIDELEQLFEKHYQTFMQK